MFDDILCNGCDKNGFRNVLFKDENIFKKHVKLYNMYFCMKCVKKCKCNKCDVILCYNDYFYDLGFCKLCYKKYIISTTHNNITNNLPNELVYMIFNF
jgi:hypothetical protein